MKRLAFILFMALSLSQSAQQTMGAFFNDEKSYNGYTLFSNNNFTYLIDNCGFVVNEWESEYRCNNGLYLSTEGKLIRQGKISGLGAFGGSGGIIERFDWHGNLEWSFEVANDNFIAHHDIKLMPNGNILLTVWEILSPESAKDEGRITVGKLYSEQIWEIKPINTNQIDIVWRWSALDHAIQDANDTKLNYGNVEEHPELIDLNYLTSDINPYEEWLHINSIDYNEELDQIAICSRNTSEVYVIDHSTTTAEAATGSGGKYGKGGDILYRYGNPDAYDHGSASDQLLHQAHDVSWIEEGQYKNDFIIFNNKYISNIRSRIQIWKNPADNGNYEFTDENLFGLDEIRWSYDSLGFYSSIMSSAQYLPNGNILATEGSSGEISEFTPDKEKVWKYINPVNTSGGPGIQGGTPQFNALFRSSRYPIDYVGFEGFDLTPKEPVELLPDDNGCEIHPITSTIDFDPDLTENQFYIVENFLVWKDSDIPESPVHIYNITGQLCMKIDIDYVGEHIDISRLSTGLYILKNKNNRPQKFYKH